MVIIEGHSHKIYSCNVHWIATSCLPVRMIPIEGIHLQVCVKDFPTDTWFQRDMLEFCWFKAVQDCHYPCSWWAILWFVFTPQKHFLEDIHDRTKLQKEATHTWTDVHLNVSHYTQPRNMIIEGHSHKRHSFMYWCALLLSTFVAYLLVDSKLRSYNFKCICKLLP